jgi:hypothetical protein
MQLKIVYILFFIFIFAIIQYEKSHLLLQLWNNVLYYGSFILYVLCYQKGFPLQKQKRQVPKNE